jgi:hypothetical protein
MSDIQDIIIEPGKFEGQPAYAPYFYDALMNGDGEIVESHGREIAIFDVTPKDIEAFPHLLVGKAHVVLKIDEHRFVPAQTFDSTEALYKEYDDVF